MANMDTYNGPIIANGGTVVGDTISCTGAYIVFFGTYSGLTVAFEGTTDGGTTWIPVGAYRIDSTTNTLATTASPTGSQQYYAMVGAFKQFRVRATAFTSGTAQVAVQVVTDADPVQPGSGSTAVSNFPTAAAGADAVTNPTTTTVFADNMAFNGTTWDRWRGNWQAAVDTSAARTTTATGTAQINYNSQGALIYLNVTAATGTTPTLVFKVQWSFDGGTTYVDLDATNATTASITAAGTAVIRIYPGVATAANGSLNSQLPRFWRTAWVIGGTTPSFTFASYVSYNI